jgi:hypothetical protein
MVDTKTLSGPETDAPLTWFIGGALLLATVIVGVVQPAISQIVFGGSIRTVLFSVALLFFAWGIHRSGSVTARRPLGTTALTALAAWLLLGSVFEGVIAESFSNDPAPGALQVFSYLDSFVRFALAFVAVMQIARAGVVPAPWNWAPAWVVGAASASWLVMAIVAVGASQDYVIFTMLLLSVDGLVRVGGTVLLGVLAIVLADRARRPKTVTAARVANPIRADAE